MLKDERLVTPQMADSAKVEGVRGPTFDAVDKGALGRSDHNLSSVSMSTIGEMNDDADYATRIRVRYYVLLHLGRVGERMHISAEELQKKWAEATGMDDDKLRQIKENSIGNYK